jgi:DNA repair protein RadD
MNLRPYQQKALDDLTSSRESALLCLQTGLGKTVTLAELALLEVQGGGKVLWLTHRRELVFQASAALRDAWLTLGINTFVKSVQELLERPGPRGITLLVLDEAHHFVADEWNKVLEQYPGVWVVGASATPERADGRGLGAIFKRMVTGPTVKEAIRDGYLCPVEVLRPEKPLGPGELAQDPVKAYLAKAAATKAVAFYSSVELAVQGSCAFRDAGIRTGTIWGAQPTKDRDNVINRFKEGTIDVICNVNILTEGTDLPAIETIILARGFGTTGGYLQAVGRALRPAPGKSSALVLDLRGCSHDHGEPDDDRTYHLEGRGIRRPVDGIDVRFCPVCGAPVVASECEECGHSGQMRLRPPRVLGLPLERFARFIAEPDDDRAKRLAKWLREGKAKGHKEGAACHRFKGVYQTWPSPTVLQKARVLAR